VDGVAPRAITRYNTGSRRLARRTLEAKSHGLPDALSRSKQRLTRAAPSRDSIEKAIHRGSIIA
jgi:hypothetical protein